MRSASKALSISLSMACAGCVSNTVDETRMSGKLAVLGNASVAERFEGLSETSVSGEGCFDLLLAPCLMANDLAIQRAFDRAIANVSAATALVDVVLDDHGECVQVT